MCETWLARGMIRNVGSDDSTGLDVGNLHPPKIGHVVRDVRASPVHRVGSEDACKGTDARYRVARGVDQVQVPTASIPRLCLLKERAGEGKQGIMRRVREMHLSGDIAAGGVQYVDEVKRV